ncbi:hypothetical protein JOD54_006152 [Actinokineospora baliensis]|uniref:LamG-like jellyroll fold domain-containing protein n=1 Tax=Actinokineospora baliensis TaxID=547056 RepID=UPI001959C311|nr:LamG-like jellyroll fold domain-containing protein [Actinokineospora baliensis]MBM7775948.1 hypothetical protein [Actinokineospora baliensis]
MRRSSRLSSSGPVTRTAALAGQALLVAGLVITGLSVPAAAAPAKPSAEPAPLSAAEKSAFSAARKTGKPVAIADQVTESTQVLARPDGSFVFESSAAPQRVKRGDHWVGIDPALRANADGSLSPAATPLDVSFSGGGTAPYITLKSAEGQVALHWPTPLPAPRVEGSKVTYAGVLPGVDLVLIASALSYQQVLVVHDEAAAANPSLRQVKVTARTTGLELRTGADGALSAVDSAGKAVFTGSTPTMWDSSKPAATDATPTAADPKAGRVDKVAITARAVAVEQPAGKLTAAARTTVKAAEVAIAPDVAALTRPGVKYPVYVDPSLTGNQLAWGETTANGYSYFNANMDAQVGRCYNGAGACGSLTTARSFFRLNTEPIKPRSGWAAVVWTAGVYTTQTHGAHLCTAEPVRLWSAPPIFSGMSWNNPGLSGLLDTKYSGAGDQCGGAGGVAFDAAPVKDFVQTAANGGWNDITVALAAADENQQLQWKKFATSGAAAPKLVAEFSYRPNQPTGLNIPAAAKCTPYPQVVGTSTPALQASATDNNDPPLPIVLRYEIYNRATNALVTHSGDAAQISSGTVGTWTTPVLPDGDYRYQVGAIGLYPGYPARYLWGPAYSSVLDFNVRSAPLTQTPTIRPSADYPKLAWGAPANAPGSVMLNDPGNAEVEGFTYTFNGPGTEVVPGPTDCVYDRVFGTTGGWVSGRSNVNVRLPAGLSPGYHTMYVRSFDRAHKLSPESQAYEFYVAPNVASPSTLIEAETMTISQPNGQNSTVGVQADCCGVDWSGTGQVHFVGNAVNQTFTLAFTVGTERDYDLGVGITKSYDYGIVSYKIDGQSVGQPSPNGPAGSYDTYDVVVRYGQVSLGTRRLTAGTHTLTVTMTGTNPASVGSRYHAGVDYLVLAPTGRFEAEQASQVTVTASAGVTFGRQDQAAGTASWSEGAQLAIDTTAAGQSAELAFRIPTEADYAIGLNLTTGPQQGIVNVLLDDTQLGEAKSTPLDTYTAAVGTTYYRLGGAHLTAGIHKVKLVVVGRNSGSSGFKVGVDHLNAIAFANSTVTDFTSAMNNNGIAPDGTAADLDTNGIAGISAQTLAAAGMAPGQSVAVEGATFVMPAHRADGNDNVIAFGQTISLPVSQQVKASAVGFLVVDTCYQIPERTGAVTYQDNTVDKPRFPSVPDWFDGPKGSAQVVLPYVTWGTSTNNAYQPRIYAIFVPTDPTKALKNVTLPNYGTPFLPGCNGGSALHVLAMAPRPVQAGWLGAWASQPDTVTVPPAGAGFANQTVRTVVHPSVTGSQVRITLTNAGNPSPLTVNKASVGAQQGTGVDSVAAPVALAFGGSASVTIPVGGEVTSDAVAFPSTSGGSGNLVVSVYHSAAASRVPAHSGATAAVRLGAGDLTTTASGSGFTTTLTGTYVLSGLQVSTSDSSLGTVVVLGDQQSAAADSDVSAGHRKTWVDKLPDALNTAGMPLPGSIVNASRSGLSTSASWRMNEASGTTLIDANGSNAGTLTGGYTRSTERGGAVDFNGSTGHATMAGSPISTTQSYTVSAWVKLESTAASATVFSRGDSSTGSLQLLYSKPQNAWALTNPAGGASAVVVGSAPELNVWTHLVGTYDAAAKEMRLYVNGVSAGGSRSVVDGAGPFVIGAGKSAGGTVSGYFNGLISELRVFQGLATDTDAGVLFQGNAVTGQQAGVSAPSLFDAAATLGRNVYDEPNLRTVVVALGANDVLAGKNKSDILAGFKSVMLQSNAGALRNTRRSDGDLTHVIVSTIPALGLAANDPREITRQQVNNDLLVNFTDQGADEIINIAGTVADPSNVNLVNPSYLTGGLLNDAYFTAVADAIALAASSFPPTAQF